KFLGLIAQYPAELHQTYRDAFNIWINVCSLKIKLNAMQPRDERRAFEVQTEMLEQMQDFDKLREALDHYNENKRILATESKSDFTNLSPLEILTRRNNLRGLITRRKQTIAKMEAELPPADDLTYYKKRSAINRKKEQL